MTEYDAEAFDAFERAGWTSKEAAAYDVLAGKITSRVANRLVDAVEAGPGKRVLDVATGPGYVAASAAARGAEVTGLDFSEAMLAHARSRSPDVDFVHGDATALPFADESFDAVTTAFLLLHLGRPERAVAEAARVLVREGRVAYTVWDEPSRARWLGVLLDAVQAVGAATPVHIPPGPPIFRFAEEDAFRALLTAGGFADVIVDTLDDTLKVESGDALWEGLGSGTVRVGPLVHAQPEAVQRAIRERFDELLEEYRNDDGFEVPVSVKLAAGTKA